MHLVFRPRHDRRIFVKDAVNGRILALGEETLRKKDCILLTTLSFFNLNDNYNACLPAYDLNWIPEKSTIPRDRNKRTIWIFFSKDSEIPEVRHILITICNQNTSMTFDNITGIPWRHKIVVKVYIDFPCRKGCWYGHLDTEPLCSLGGTGRASTAFGSVKLWFGFVNVTCLKTTANTVQPEKKK